MRRDQPRNVIFGVLNEVYAPEVKEIDWWASKARKSYVLDVNRSVTTDILSHLVFAMTQDASSDMGEYWQRTLLREVTNIIWATHSGGTTAEYTAKKIFEALNLPVPDEEV